MVKDEVVDIHAEIASICERIGLDPRYVEKMLLTPFELTVEVFLHGNEGKKYLDFAKGEPTTRVVTRKVKM